MGERPHKKPFACILLIILQISLGTGAVVGGLGLSIDPSGELIQMPTEFLETSPFSNFFIPGLVLFFTLGIFPLVVSIGLIRKKPWTLADKLNLFSEKHWSWAYSLYTGFVLVCWITLQVYFIQRVGLVHVVYIFWGLLILAITLLPPVQKYYAK